MSKVYGDEMTAKDQWARLKGRGPKAYIQYFIDYYGILTLVILVLLIFIISLTRSIIYNSIPDIIEGEYFAGMFNEDKQEDLKLRLAEIMNVDPDDYHISVSSSTGYMDNAEYAYANNMKFIARLTANDIDFVISNRGAINLYMDMDEEGGGAAVDLHEYFSDEELKELDDAGRLLYFDSKYIDPFPYLIDITGTELYDLLETMSAEPLYIGYISNSAHRDALIALKELIR